LLKSLVDVPRDVLAEDKFELAKLSGSTNTDAHPAFEPP